jgi:acetoin utilization deacetylase AcuC-like enzyme
MHIEVPRRVEAIHEMVKENYTVVSVPSRMGSKEEICRIHDAGYVDWVEEAYEKGIRQIVSSDTILGPKSYEVALKAATSTKHVIDGFKERHFQKAFLNLRPPGHHAERITGQGFCIFNNIALMARYAQDAGYERVMIIDFDVHHGNGTQDIFYADDSVYFFSTHEKDNYPYFTGSADEQGEDKGVGYTRNIPYKSDIRDDEFLALYEHLPDDFDFDIVLVSAGYDMMGDEGISTTHITLDGLEQMVKKIVGFADGRPIAFLLEGGYEIDSLVASVDRTLKVLSS